MVADGLDALADAAELAGIEGTAGILDAAELDGMEGTGGILCVVAAALVLLPAACDGGIGIGVNPLPPLAACELLLAALYPVGCADGGGGPTLLLPLLALEEGLDDGGGGPGLDPLLLPPPPLPPILKFCYLSARFVCFDF